MAQSCLLFFFYFIITQLRNKNLGKKNNRYGCAVIASLDILWMIRCYTVITDVEKCPST